MSDSNNINKTDALIIGKGPAGVQAAIYVARSGQSLAIVGHGTGSLERAAYIENYYGLPEPVSGADLQRNGEAQAFALGARIYEGQVVGFGFNDEGSYKVFTTAGEFHTKTILIATGVKRDKISVKGIDLYEGKGVSYCAVCDGYLYRGKKTGVLGHREYAYAEACELAAMSGGTVIFTNGKEPRFGAGASDMDKDKFEIVTDQIMELEGEGRLSGVRFRNGGFRELDGLFVAYGLAGSADLARKLGVAVSKRGDIMTDQNQGTNVPGVYAAGDCTGAFRQVAVAVGQGAIAARQMIEYVRSK